MSPGKENSAMSDASVDDQACNDSTEQQETTAGGLSRFQDVGTSPISNNNSSMDEDTELTTNNTETQSAAASINSARSVCAHNIVSSSETTNNSASAGAVGEAEDDGHATSARCQSHVMSNGHAAAAGGAETRTIDAANGKGYEEGSYVQTEVACAAAFEEGQSNGDDDATDVAVCTAREGDASIASSLPSAQGSASDFNSRTVAAIRRSIHETPGAFYVTPINARRGEEATADEEYAGPDDTNTTTDGSGSNHGAGRVDADLEQEELHSSDIISQPRRGSNVTLTEAWVVEEGGTASPPAASPPDASAQLTGQSGGAGPSAGAAPLAQPTGLTSDSSESSLDIDASVEPAIVIVTATPLKEARSWFKTPTGILLILLLGGIVALAVAFPARKNASSAQASAGRPFEIVIPSMPQDVSDMLEFKYNKLIEGQPIPMAFSADLTVHAASRIDEYFGQLQVVQYNATSSSWDVVVKYDKEEAREQDLLKDGQIGNSAGDNFGSWADMSYDGRILAIGLPRDDPFNIPDAGSVRVMELESNNNALWNLKGYGNCIAGVDPHGWTGTIFSLTADGSMIAVGSPLASKSRGTILVYKFEPGDAITDGGAWVQMGQTIVGDSFGLVFAKLSEDGTILAAGSMQHGKDGGQLKIFRWDDAAKLWVQMGGAIEGNAKSRLGAFPQFSRDGLTVAFSQAGEPHKCHVYQWDENEKDWEQINDEQGFPERYVCMDLSPDGKKVILCSTDEQRCILNLFRSGEWHEVQEFLQEDGFLPYRFEREGEGDTIAGIVAPIRKEESYTIGFYDV